MLMGGPPGGLRFTSCKRSRGRSSWLLSKKSQYPAEQSVAHERMGGYALCLSRSGSVQRRLFL